MPTKKSLTLKTALTDITVVLGAATTVGEGVLAALPSGPVHTAIAVALPIMLALAAGLRKVLGS